MRRQRMKGQRMKRQRMSDPILRALAVLIIIMMRIVELISIKEHILHNLATKKIITARSSS